MKINHRTDLIVDPIFETIDGEDGRDGIDGANGQDGRDGHDGADGQGFALRGEWRPTTYQPHDVVEHDGSSYVARVETKSEPPSKAWQLLAAKGDAGEDGIGQRGPRGQDGASAATDVEMLFEETAIAGQVVRSSGDGLCAITNALSYYTCIETVGLAVADTPAGRRGLVRTVGLITRKNWSPLTGEPQLVAGRTYILNGYGGLSPYSPCNVAMFIPIGVAIKSDTLLISPEQSSRYTKAVSDLKAPCLSTLLKGSPVRLATADSVDVASMPDNWQVAGVLTEDVAAGDEATYRRVATITRDDWSSLLESGDTLLVANANYYLSDTPGKFTTDDTDRLFIGKAKNAQSLRVTVGDPTPSNPIVT